MATKINIPTPLRPFTGKQDVVEVDGATVGELLGHLTSKHEGLKKHLYNDEGKLRSFVNIYLNDEDIRYLDREQTAVKPGDTLSIIPSVAGGIGAAEAPPVTLNADEIKRYSRHLILPEVGMEGQKKLKAARVLCIGAGGLGSPVAMYLAAAGVGTIGIVDFDVVDFSNLQRQILHGTPDVGRPKLQSASDRLQALNPNVKVELYDTALTSENALQLFKDYDVIVDGTDNFPTRYLVNDACVILGKPNAYGSIFRFEGQASVFGTKEGPCYRCLYPEPPPPGLVPSCAEGGVLGVLARHRRLHPGQRDAEAHSRHRRAAGGPLPGVRRAADEVPRAEAAQGSGLPGVRHAPDRHRAHRLRAVLRRVARAADGGRAGRGQRHRDQRHRAQGRMDRGEDVFVLDVREPHEYEINRIPGSTLIPLGDLAERFAELDANREIIAQCKSGMRSARAASFLREHGFKNVKNLKGGILAWVDQIDPSQPKY